MKPWILESCLKVSTFIVRSRRESGLSVFYLVNVSVVGMRKSEMSPKTSRAKGVGRLDKRSSSSVRITIPELFSQCLKPYFLPSRVSVCSFLVACSGKP